MTTQTLQFLRRGQPVALGNVPPDRTLLEVLREDLGHTGTKEGCGEGDCGACTVVLGEARDGKVHYSAVNSCIRLAHSVHGMALWTVEDLAEDPLIQPVGDAALAPRPPITLHPAQEAMVQCHGSQCGFCTPGFVMSLFGMYQKHIAPTLPTACGSLPPSGEGPPDSRAPGALAPRGGPSTLDHVRQGQPITRELAQEELSGNLCRCTGYRPILDAAQHMGALPAMAVNEPLLLQKLELLALHHPAPEANSSYISPTTLTDLLAARAEHPAAQVVAGCTDVGLWVTKQHKQYESILDVTRVAELRQVQQDNHHITLGAAVTLTDAFAALTAQWPQLHTFATRFAGLPVRNSGTLGGNVANGSPIGDSMPLLIALRAQVVLASVRGERAMALEDLYTGYRQNVMAPDELLVRIVVPRPGVTESEPPGRPKAASAPRPGEAGAPSPAGGSEHTPVPSVGANILRAYKISKRFDDDISAVCLVINLDIEADVVRRASIGAGGVAATPARARQTEAALTGQPWNADTIARAAQALQGEFNPISDMRASGAYRRTVLASLLQRFWLESQGEEAVSVENFRLEEAV
ncbi:xanthine dehydrogenase small subunit [Acidovorax radicis]|uniref:xanthine dehydrogenase small subunit n=1 Tax=Acidovorax radicis TaxID=758826 RepID=UPI00023769D1|nr:FAD binding domain-containing protein [Acidovorax radicis]